jgi:hypothetical protein
MTMYKFVCLKCNCLTIVEPPEYECECGANYSMYGHFFAPRGVTIKKIEVEEEDQ